DTGCSVLLVTHNLAAKLKLDGRKVVTLDRVEVEGGACVERMKAMVSDPAPLGQLNGLGLPEGEIQGILGYTLLARFRIELDFTRDKMAWVPLEHVPDSGNAEARMTYPQGRARQAPVKVVPAARSGLLGVELVERDGGVFIEKVLQGSAAATAGMKGGD